MHLSLGFKKVLLSITTVLILTCWCQPVKAETLTVEALIDGISQLIIQEKTVQWKHLAWTAPGYEEQDPPGLPTILTTTHMNESWYPGWPDGTFIDPNDPNAPEVLWSTQFTSLNLALAAVEQLDVGLEIIQERTPGNNWVSIIEYPTAANDYKLIVNFDDFDASGAATYIVKLDYTPVPLPPTILLLGSGLLGLVGLRRFRKK